MTRVYDITPPLTARLGVWPGDTPMTREVLCELAKGDSVTLSTIRATVHLGAHADGPNHYTPSGVGIGERDLSYYLGLCMVVDAPVARGSRVRVEDVARHLPGGTAGGLAAIAAPRVLIRTGTFPDFQAWNDDFAGLEPALVDALAARGVITIGVDTPSVDLQTSKDLPAHAACARHDISILEGLALDAVTPGAYELIALPLRLMGFDASPVRAVLREL
ncbi:MAG: cyclase family protein [Planctomycetota bacterium]|nr:cyclase family protein [Planctomycetota bacterium]